MMLLSVARHSMRTANDCYELRILEAAFAFVIIIRIFGFDGLILIT